MQRAIGLLILALGSAACGAPAASRASGEPIATTRTADARPIAQIHASKCGSCHVPVEPGSRSRGQIEAALGRHGKRLKLTQDQWHAMIDYLAPPVDSVQAKAADDQNVR